MNEKITIRTDKGDIVEALAPIIISASRSTDIPAFYAKWFLNRLAKGYCIWYNPFNRKPMYVSFERTKVIVFWTKNPAPIIPYLNELDKKGIHYYFQFTLNDYGYEGFEPNVPPLESRVQTFKQLSEKIGKDRVIWRFDPLILSPGITPRNLLSKIWHVGNMLKGYTNKLVFSFVDVKDYRKVKLNLVRETSFFSTENVDSAEMNDFQRQEVVEGIVRLREKWKTEGWDLQLATCAENIDLESLGIEHNRCIDGELMEILWPNDKELMYYLSTGKLPTPNLFGDIPEMPNSKKNLKDKGQRKVCGCMVSKDIGMYDTCRHFCIYCYANTSKDAVLRNKEKHNDNSESIIE